MRLLILKLIIIFILFIFTIEIFFNYNNIDNKIIPEKFISNNSDSKFLIIYVNYSSCGLFAFYKHYLGCSFRAFIMGYTPIIDLISFPNVFNNFNQTILKTNPYEYYFDQPFNYTLEEVLKSNNFEVYDCRKYGHSYPSYNIINNQITLGFWQYFAKKYMPVKIEIIKEAIFIKNKLFNLSNNILGIMTRGTDYISLKPKDHPIQPKLSVVLSDIKKLDYENKYDFYFLATEDYFIRLKFMKEFGNKIKFFNQNQNFHFNYLKKQKLCTFKGIIGNFEYMKTYLISIIILTKSIDIITSITSGTIGIFILSEGFRNQIVYDLGVYR